jgi:hypothetical protein
LCGGTHHLDRLRHDFEADVVAFQYADAKRRAHVRGPLGATVDRQRVLPTDRT